MPIFSRNVDLGPAKRISSWRKIAIGTWRTCGDPSVYGMIDLEAESALSFIEKERIRTGRRITVTHLVGKIIGEILSRHPDLNCMLRMGRLYPRKNVDLCFQVASDRKGEDLSGTTIRKIDQKSLADIAQEFEQNVSLIREQKDPSYKKMKSIMGVMPGFMASFLINLTAFISYTLNFWLPFLGVPKDAFGSGMITNIGSLGLDMALAPLVPYSRAPFVLVLGGIQERPIVRNGQVVAAKMLRMCFTVDHRLIDGVHASLMYATLKKIFENPEAELKSH